MVMAQRYSHVADRTLDEAVKALERGMAKKAKRKEDHAEQPGIALFLASRALMV